MPDAYICIIIQNNYVLCLRVKQQKNNKKKNKAQAKLTSMFTKNFFDFFPHRVEEKKNVECSINQSINQSNLSCCCYYYYYFFS